VPFKLPSEAFLWSFVLFASVQCEASPQNEGSFA